jgi:hypothetical protein
MIIRVIREDIIKEGKVIMRFVLKENLAFFLVFNYFLALYLIPKAFFIIYKISFTFNLYLYFFYLKPLFTLLLLARDK